ncbi:MAG TPA: hypothetical protein VHW25_01685 [Steroidobacteraceae bacterium]|nr:hypothetical protein [Steroidobacteraceae bacterium]
MPATNPVWFTFENASPVFGYPGQYWVNKIDSHSKAGRFNEGVDPKRLTLGDVIHLAATADGDAVAHVWIDEIGMYSGKFSTQYIPRVNIRGKLWTKWSEDSLYSEEVNYGVDARKGKAWAIEPDDRYRWGSFDELMAGIEDVRAAYTMGARLAAMRLADQIGVAAAAAK